MAGAEEGAFAPHRAWALAPLAFYAIHCGRHLRAGRVEDLLWACHLANLILALAVVLRSRQALSLAFYWLVQGNILWLIDLISGGELLLTSALTHCGGLMLSLVWIRRVGSAPWSPLLALVSFAALQGLTRLSTGAEANVNLAHRLPDGWEDMAPNLAVYLTGLYAQGAALFWLCAKLTRREEGA